MNQLVVIQNNEPVTDSLIISEVFEKSHDKVLRDIRNMECSSQFRLANFGESSYRNKQNRQMPLYYITQDGFSFLVMGYTGKEAARFKEQYINEFNRMKQKLQQPKALSEKDQLKAAMKFSLEHDEMLNEHNERLTHLEETMRIDGTEEHRIRKSANAKIMEVIGGKKSPAYKELARQVFSAFWRDFKNHFTIPRYGDLPKKQFDEGLRFISLWQPDTSLRMEIESANKQQVIREVI